jgi:hypothetical protein
LAETRPSPNPHAAEGDLLISMRGFRSWTGSGDHEVLGEVMKGEANQWTAREANAVQVLTTGI